MGEIKKGSGEDILLPIGSSVYAKGKIKKVDKMIVGLGANTAIEGTLEKTKKILEKRKKIMEIGLASVEKEIVSLNNELVSLQPEIQTMLKEAKNPSSAG
jgi:prefoldin alpha subunit